MKSRVYIETTVVSYLTARPSRDLVLAARQEVTRELWPRLTDEFETFVSALVIQEASQGDADAAEKRLDAIGELPVLEISEEAEALAEALTHANAIPPEHPEDALHVAVAAINGADLLVTWNFSHLNNAFTRSEIRGVVEQHGVACPEICSPEELVGGET